MQRDARWTLAGTSFLLGVAILLCPSSAVWKTPAAILVLLWGFAFGALPIAMQGWMLKAAPDEMESASAMFISVLQIGLASGALLGGVVVDRFGLNATLAGSGCAALATAALVWIFGRDRGATMGLCAQQPAFSETIPASIVNVVRTDADWFGSCLGRSRESTAYVSSRANRTVSIRHSI